MFGYIIRRVAIMPPTLIMISFLAFMVVELPEGDMASAYVSRLERMGEEFRGDATEMLEGLRLRFGYGQPLHVRYLKWARDFLRGSWGHSFFWDLPVRTVVQDRILLTVMLTLMTVLIGTAVSWPAGVGAAIRQYSLFDNIFSFTAFVMMAVPNFLFALVLMYLSYKLIDFVPGGLFSPDMIDEPWGVTKFLDFLKHIWMPLVILGFESIGGGVIDFVPGGLFSPDMIDEPWGVTKFLDFLKHIWMPLVILGFESIGGGVRSIRANVLDQLRQPFVTTARAKGVPETRLLIKYPIRMAANPWVSSIGWMLPALVSGEVLVATVLSIPTIGPLMLQGVMNQDTQVAGAIVMILSTLTVIGTLISDLLLAVLDPRIRVAE